MKVEELQKVVEREPFLPFTFRLNNGFFHTVATRRSVGASKDYEMIFVFPETGGSVRIDPDSIVEIIESK